MSVVFVLVFAAILMAGGFLVAFIWSVKSGQYDDTYTPSVRILFDDTMKKKEDGNKKKEKKSEVGSQKTEGRKTENEKTRSIQSQLIDNPQLESRNS